MATFWLPMSTVTSSLDDVVPGGGGGAWGVEAAGMIAFGGFDSMSRVKYAAR